MSNQPIVFYCIREEEAYNYKLAYWPYDQETGEKLLAFLDRLIVDDLDRHVNVNDLLEQIARNTLEAGDYKKSIMLLEKEVLNNHGLDKLGILCPIKPTNYFSDDEKKFFENPALFKVSIAQLSPHLYYQECMAYC